MIADISSGRRRLRVTGEDRAAFLHGQCTNEVLSVKPGDNCYAAFLNAKGKMRGEGHIICMPELFLMEVNEDLLSSLEKFVITEDVTIQDVSTELACYLILAEAAATEEIPPNAVTFAHPMGTGVLSSMTLPVTLNAETLDAMRIEAGIPQWGVDMDENTIPNEAGLESRAISYTKGCYIGQETIARIKTYGHVNRYLIQLSLDISCLPERGEKVFSEDREVGRVTSAARSNRLGKTLALGYVRREFAVKGIRLTIGQQTAEVLTICGR